MNNLLFLVIFILIMFLILKQLRKKRIEKMLNISTLPTITLYYTTWCHYSQEALVHWSQLEQDKEFLKKINITKIDCDKEKCPHITAYPTVIITNSTNKPIIMNTNITLESLKQFINTST